MSKPLITIAPFHSTDDIQDIKHLFRDYADALDIDLSFQNFGQGSSISTMAATDAGLCARMRPLVVDDSEMIASKSTTHRKGYKRV